MVPIWEEKIKTKLKGVPEDDEQRKVTIKETPDVELPSSPEPAKPAVEALVKEEPKAVLPTPKDKIKTDWYQTTSTVTLSIMARGVLKDQASVEIEKDSVSIAFPVAGSSSEYHYSLDPLYASIDPAQSKYRVTPTKVEVTMHKATPGVKWHSLEGEERAAETVADSETKSIPYHVLTGKDIAPAYPTSSKSGVKDWDKVVTSDLDDKDAIEGDETSHFFKQLYSGATPEQQRAMMKSYSESGGTVLSTDWSNVGKKTVVPEPPEGMEAKDY
jgi:suppressor of G2 allele of SKP1